MKLVTIALALLMALATAAHADGKPVSKKPYSDWVWEDIGCRRKCPEQEGTERAHREFDKGNAIRRRGEAYAKARRELDQASAIRRRDEAYAKARRELDQADAIRRRDEAYASSSSSSRMTKPNERAPTKRDDTAQSNAPQPNSKASERQPLN